MLGGYQIINLTNIDLTIGNSQVSITDKDVLDQLRGLREHIEDNYNFVVPLNRKLKPVLLRLRDKKNGEKQEVSIWANMSIITNNKTFKIEALVDSVSMKAIQIEVVFQQLTDDDGNPYWDIKTAKYLYTENIGIGGNMSIDGNLSVTGSINGEENPSVKPLYWHGIRIEYLESDVFKGYITIVIINNSAVQINTLQDVFDTMFSFGEYAFVNADGYINTAEIYLGLNLIGFYKYADKLYLQTYRNDFTHTVVSKTPQEWVQAFANGTTNVVDLVNKLN